VKNKIAEEMRKTELSMTEEMGDLFRGKNAECNFITKIPCEGLNTEDILCKVADYLELGELG
jgi:hypothetical protein